ncbi:MAG TPA: DUF1684 domain-containing protein [Phototrophicaceae bacterium]|nr:DUF1684 domain-containing protein [Phototrophicaceae bacterium]
MLDLLDYRRTVASIYRTVRETPDHAEARKFWQQQRDELFHTHPQSALDDAQKAAFTGLIYYDYDPAFRVITRVETDVEPQEFQADVGNDGVVGYRRFGRVQFTLPTGSGSLSVYWITGYGGGVFIPFGDTTNNRTTYGGGRYLIDTIKGADLGTTMTDIVLDFNFAYHPSCTYNPRWTCPLTMPENRLKFPVTVGEQIVKE